MWLLARRLECERSFTYTRSSLLPNERAWLLAGALRVQQDLERAVALIDGLLKHLNVSLQRTKSVNDLRKIIDLNGG